MTETRKLKCLNALDIKIIAMLLMLCDHLWATLIPGNRWLTDIGRMAFPIFAFQIAEGYFETHNYKKYLKRLFIFALISEIPFNLMYSGSFIYPFHQNVLFCFCIALVLMRLADKLRAKENFVFSLGFVAICLKGKVVFALGFVAICFIGYWAGNIFMVDYYGYGILMVLTFYLFHGMRYGWIGELASMILINGIMMNGMTIELEIMGHGFSFPQQAFAVFALIPVWLYNHKQGPHNKKIQMACYSFYPVHMLLLAAVKMIAQAL